VFCTAAAAAMLEKQCHHQKIKKRRPVIRNVPGRNVFS
jgi:hypothetical protein